MIQASLTDVETWLLCEVGADFSLPYEYVPTRYLVSSSNGITYLIVTMLELGIRNLGD